MLAPRRPSWRTPSPRTPSGPVENLWLEGDKHSHLLGLDPGFMRKAFPSSGASEAFPIAGGPAFICSTRELIPQNPPTGTTGMGKQNHVRVTWMVEVTKGQSGTEAAASYKLLDRDQLRGKADGKSGEEMLCRRHREGACFIPGVFSSAVSH